MRKVGFVGWRGMVGSVLMERMNQEKDFHGFEPVFFTTSQIGQDGPDVGHGTKPLEDAMDTEKLAEMDIIISCQGGSYTASVYEKLRKTWNGYWIDAASSLRMEDNSIIVLDPVNRTIIDEGLEAGVKDYIGGNCTVSPDADGTWRVVRAGPHRMDHLYDLPGGKWRRREEYA